MPVRSTAASSAQNYFIERRASRQQRLAESKQPKEVKKAAPEQSSDAATVKLSTDAPKAESKNFIGNTAGANVVNIAVQGGRGGDKLAVFASGEGPKPAKPPVEKKPEEQKSEPKVESVDTVA